ncbi:hypothetical protein Tco_0440460, partial [Tanacetum coccineum]
MRILPKRSPWTNEFGGRVKRQDPKQALRGRHPMLIQISQIVKNLVLAVSTRVSHPQLHDWES